MTAADLVVHGPAVFPADPRGMDVGTWREYVETWLHDERAGLPPPTATNPLRVEGLSEVVEFFQGIAHALSWLWLASSARITGTSVAIRFEGAADLDFDLTSLPDPSRAEEAVRLWQWAAATTDPARREALQQAVSMVVREPAMLERSAERVLRSAKYLFRLARQGAVAEAMAMRRTARQAAIEAAQASADASRTASRSVVDRVLTQLVGVLGVLLADQAAVINATMAGWLLLGILSLTVATGVVAFAFEYPGADGALGAFEEDLEGYSDMLIEDDINHIKEMRSLAAANKQLGRARWISAVLLVVAATAVITARVLI